MITNLFVIELNDYQSIVFYRQDTLNSEGWENRYVSDPIQIIDTHYYAHCKVEKFATLNRQYTYGRSDTICYPLKMSGLYANTLDELLDRVYAFIADNNYHILGEYWITDNYPIEYLQRLFDK